MLLKQEISNLLLLNSTDTDNTLAVDSEIRGIVMTYIFNVHDVLFLKLFKLNHVEGLVRHRVNIIELNWHPSIPNQ